MEAAVDVEVMQFVGVHLAVLDSGQSRLPVAALAFAALQLRQRAVDPDQPHQNNAPGPGEGYPGRVLLLV